MYISDKPFTMQYNTQRSQQNQISSISENGLMNFHIFVNIWVTTDPILLCDLSKCSHCKGLSGTNTMIAENRETGTHP